MASVNSEAQALTSLVLISARYCMDREDMAKRFNEFYNDAKELDILDRCDGIFNESLYSDESKRVKVDWLVKRCDEVLRPALEKAKQTGGYVEWTLHLAEISACFSQDEADMAVRYQEAYRVAQRHNTLGTLALLFTRFGLKA